MKEVSLLDFLNKQIIAADLHLNRELRRLHAYGKIDYTEYRMSCPLRPLYLKGKTD